MKRHRPRKLCKSLLPVLQQIADDTTQPTELRLWAIGSASRLASGLPVSSTALNALILRTREAQKTPPAAPTPAPAKPQFTAKDLGRPEIKGPQDALAMIRGTKG
jgi:hypothetical protein